MASEADPDLALAHHDRACAQALQRRRIGACEAGVALRPILEAPPTAASLDPGHREPMGRDSDLEDLRSTLWFRAIEGADVGAEAGARAALAGIDFVRPDRTPGRLVLAGDGAARVDGGPAGTLAAEAGGVRIRWPDGEVRYALSRQGDLAAGDEVEWVDLAPACPGP